MDQTFQSAFRYCPICGTENPDSGKIPFVCSQCDFHFYFPTTTAVGGLLTDSNNRVLLIERARDPGQGLLGLPGGFVDPGESAEQAMVREIHEEIGLEVTELNYLATFPNRYHYRGFVTDVLDIFYFSKIDCFDSLKLQRSEVSAFHFETPNDEVLAQMAFESNRQALRLFRQKHL